MSRKEILVTRSSMPPLEEYIEEIKDLWESHWLTNMGVKHEQLREVLKDYLQVKHVELLTNGHMALELSMQALGLKGEVITSPFTFASTTHAIVRNGLTPVFCDIDPVTFTIDADKIEELITENTCAIVPIHVYGNICDVDKIDAIAKKYDLKVIYDAAHAFGETYHGRGIGSYGDVSCFSFHATKVFNTVEGGAACFADELFGIELYRLKDFGIKGPEEVDGIGANAKMNELCAAMGLCNLRHLPDEIEKRRKVVEQYRERLSGVPGLQLNPIQEEVCSNYSYFPVVVHEDVFHETREQVIERLNMHGIFPRKYFYPISSEFECYKGRFDSGLTPIAYDISRKVMTVPLYADLDISEVDRICNIILEGH